ncbi:Myb domain-containing protein 4r1 [Citrus sinensis]|uniref:Myb domain-containing protein 4r1 n=1 Tax=Citrus sinensis TaxID=2711 RepID=A0ACB8NWG5_CITSI|nr:Myb domain-containing protein 4r1 [Citrus sinensis]
MMKHLQIYHSLVLLLLSGINLMNVIDFLCCHRSSLVTSQSLLRCLLMPLRRIGHIRSLSEVSCRKVTGRALSQKKDLRVQLISSSCNSRKSKDSEGTNKKLSALNYGPAENSQVANYKMAMSKSPLSLHRKKWSKKENENLRKGIRQQFQEMMLQLSVDRFSVPEGSATDTNSLDSILASIKDLEVTPEMIRDFLPKVNWDQVASMYVQGRSGAECEARWLNFEDPLINHNPWTVEEEKSLLLIIQEKGITDWFDIAASLGTNRTPFQCLARYQRSLNACILRREWTKEEDEQLRIAVEAYGESNWQSVASTLKGRTGTQCSNRWNKTLHPSRERQGRWNPDEDQRLIVATMLFGPRNWKKIAQFVPGRTQVQCRERWVNSLDPSVKRSEWTEQEDLRLEAAIKEHGYCWSKVASALPSRTDNQCWRRWKALHPEAVPLFLEAKKIQKTALVSNFVDRERERPALRPNDFIPIPMLESAFQPEEPNASKKRKRKSSRKPESGKENDDCNTQKKIKPNRCRKEAEVCSEEVLGITNSDVMDISDQQDATQKKKKVKPRSTKKKAGCGSVATEKSSKKGSKSRPSAELDESSQSILLQPPKKENQRNTNDDDNNFSLEDTDKARRQGHGIKRCNEPSGECQGLACSSCQQDASKTSKPRSKSHFKNRLQASDGDNIPLACFLHNKPKKKKLEVPKIADQPCSSNAEETMGSLLPFETVDQQSNEQPILSQMQNGEVHTCHNAGTPEDMSLCKMRSSHLKDMQIMVVSDECIGEDKVEGGVTDKVEGATTSPSEPVSEAMPDINLEDEIEACDFTLASWLNRSSLSTQSSLNNMQNVLASDMELERGDEVKGATITPHEPVREPMSNNHKDDIDDADIPLAFLRRKLKKK